MKKSIFFVPLILIFLFISGCRPSRIAVRERPIEFHYIQPMAPGPNYIWHSPEWIRHGNTYVYNRGFWIKAPSRGRYYSAGHWQR